MAKGRIPPQLAKFQFKKGGSGTSRAKKAGGKGGRKSRPTNKKK